MATPNKTVSKNKFHGLKAWPSAKKCSVSQQKGVASTKLLYFVYSALNLSESA